MCPATRPGTHVGLRNVTSIQPRKHAQAREPGDDSLEAHPEEKEYSVEQQVVRVLAQVVERFHQQSRLPRQPVDIPPRVRQVGSRKRVYSARPSTRLTIAA